MNTEEQLHYVISQSILGSVLIAESEKGICAVLIGDSPDVLVPDLKQRFPEASISAGDDGLNKVAAGIVRFIENPDTELNIQLDIRGSDFQKRVWEVLREIPVGKTVSYREVADKLNAPGGARAVGEACAANALAVVIPCHRVVKSDGGTSGYRWGVRRKRQLLMAEGAL
jgi:AraC family transcriptional regulator, regulatory protein of adaptative response / methylated-DNA-[protein]-cysteine methyltransferase